VTREVGPVVPIDTSVDRFKSSISKGKFPIEESYLSCEFGNFSKYTFLGKVCTSLGR
jgi:hypothetical protein